MTPPPRAIVIGGGVAGLAAALRLAESGRWRPLVLERDDEPGGLARSLQFKGVSTDLGPHRIHTELPEVATLIDRIAADSLVTVRRTSHIYLRGRYLRYPPSPLEMTRRLGPWNMLRFTAGFAAERLRRAPPPERETYESLMRRAFGGPLYDFLLRPYSAKTWKIDPAELHADTARVRVSAGSLAKMVAGVFRREKKGRETSLREFRYVRGGVATLVGHLVEHARAAGAELALRREVSRLTWGEDGRILTAQLRSPAPEPALRAEAFISSAPLPILLGTLLEGHPELAAARKAAAGLQYLDMIFVCLIVRRKIISGDNWLYFPEPHLIFNRAYEAKNFDPGMGPADQSVLCLEITHRPGQRPAGESDDAILQTVVAQIASTGLFAAGEVVEGLVYRLPFAYPLYTLDYADRLAVTLDGLRRVPNLLTIGRQGLFNHNNMDHSMSMGLRAASCLLEAPPGQAAARWYDQAPAYRRMRIVD